MVAMKTAMLVTKWNVYLDFHAFNNDISAKSQDGRKKGGNSCQ